MTGLDCVCPFWLVMLASIAQCPELRRMEVEVVSRDGLPSRDGTQQIYALHGPDASQELSMLRALMQLQEAALPILPALLALLPKQARRWRRNTIPHPMHDGRSVTKRLT